ncbi:MAG: PorV/PorQ family protein [Bacteroidota bacterium]
MRKLAIMLLAVSNVLTEVALAQNFVSNVSKRGTSAAAFLSIGQGARATGMGSAFVAVADDPSAIYWNPAGLAGLKGIQIMFDHTEWIAGLKYNFLGLTVNTGGYGTIGVSLTASNIPEMKVTTIEQPNGTGLTFGVFDGAISIAYALNLTDDFSIGFNPKVVYQSIWEMSASAIAIDLGVKYKTPFRGFVLGMSISNFGSKMKMTGNSALVLYDPDPASSGNNGRIPAELSTGDWALPLNFRVGLAYHLLSSYEHKLTVSANAAHPSDDYESVDIGGEYTFKNFLSFRAGYKSLFLRNSEQSLSFGIGLAHYIVGNVEIHADYAYQDFGRLKNIQKISLGISF